MWHAADECRFPQTTSIGATFVEDQSLRRRCRSKHPHGHLPIGAGAVIGDAGETISWPGSFVWAFFFSSRDIEQLTFHEMSLLFELCHEASHELYSELFFFFYSKKQVWGRTS